MLRQLDVLLIEDNPGDARLIEEYLSRSDAWPDAAPDAIDVAHGTDLADGLALLEERDPDVVLLDLGLPDSDGLETLDRVLAAVDAAPIVVLTGRSDDTVGIESVRRGAQDFVTKDGLQAEEVVHAIQYAIERAKTKRELERRNEELAILNQLLRHDVKNDISLVIGRGQELNEYVDPRGEERLAEVVTAANHVLQLIRTIGDTVEAVTGEADRERRPVDPIEILEREIQKARRLYGDGILTFDADRDPGEVAVLADDLLAAVFGNLLGNALLYTSDAPEVRVSVVTDPETVTVRVADNGPGVPDAQKDRIFGKGEQGATSGGTGIGLYLVDELVASYDGRVWIEDNDPRGSIFNVELERAVPSDDGDGAAEESDPGA